MTDEIGGSGAHPSSPRSSIQAIKRGDVHRITSGQVVLDIQSAVKELIENALDAGATTIEVRFKEYGADLIEVADNGSGIESSNYNSLALKHHTSKLQDFADLIRVTTFGFRGEALSSLCELSKVQFTTATQSEDPVGTILEMNRDGTIQSRDRKVARKRGTTVSISDLFYTLPVRRKELVKNVKREFAKAQGLLQAYAIISSGVRWIVSNTVKGKKNTIMTIPASTPTTHLSANVNAVFGPKAAPDLVPLDLQLSLSSIERRSAITSRKQMVYDEDEDEMDGSGSEQSTLHVSGLISRPSIGCGRTSSDRCFLYVNGRPWDSPKIVRAFNEVYRQFNIQQYPMVIANFKVQGDQYDVNVSPDKRTLFLHREAEILERLKVELEEAFNPYQSVMRVNDHTSHSPNTEVPPRTREKDRHDSDEPSESATWSTVNVAAFANGRRRRSSTSSNPVEEVVNDLMIIPKRARRNGETENELPSSSNYNSGIHSNDIEISTISANTSNDSSRSSRRNVQSTSSPAKRSSAGLPKSILSPIQRSTQSRSQPPRQTLLKFKSDIRSFAAPQSTPADQMEDEELSQEEEVDEDSMECDDLSEEEVEEEGRMERDDASEDESQHSIEGEVQDSEVEEEEIAIPIKNKHCEQYSDKIDASEEEAHVESDKDREEIAIAIPSSVEARIFETQHIQHNCPATQENDHVDVNDDQNEPFQEEEASENESDPADLDESQHSSTAKQASGRIDDKGIMHIPFDLDKIADSLAALKPLATLPHREVVVPSNSNALKDAAIEQSDLATVDSILSRFIEKTDFEKMEVLGQFNLGFIIARRTKHEGEEDDLMIIDQHAADEKYNFERLTNTTKLQTQRLIVPRTLQLSPSDELTAVDHKEALYAHGFQIEIDEEALPGSRIRLVALPISQRITFGVEDLEEVLHKLADEQPNSPRALSTRCSKWRNVLASRACRSSIMIGSALKTSKMETVIRHLSTLDQPWNCPHGRPTMRHLYDLKSKGGLETASGSVSAIDWANFA